MANRRKTLLKVIILGDSGVGKTSLMNQFVNRKFSTSYKATIGADFLTKDMKIDEENVTMQIWDTAGQERFQSLGVAFYRGADCCILVYDVNNAKSFESLQNWRDEFLIQASPQDPDKFPFVVIGNKLDLQNNRDTSMSSNQLSQLQSRTLCFECSAKSALNVDKPFEEAARLSLQQQSADELIQDLPNAIDIKVSDNQDACAC